MTFREFVNLDRTEEPALTDKQFNAILAAARIWFATEYPKRRCGGRRRTAHVKPAFEEASDFDLAEELR